VTIDLAPIRDIALEAGRHIMAVYREGCSAWSKDDDSPLTEADLRAHECIDAGLRRAFPGIPVWSEEGASLAGAAHERFFLVDPLDGTKEFLKRNDEFTVNIALIEQGRPVAGVVFAPALDQLYFAAQGLGAFRRDAHGEVPLHTQEPALPLRVIGSRSHGGEALEGWLRQLACEHAFVAAGSSLKFCRIAEGQADVYPRMGPTSQWDTAAGQAVLECAGGAVLDAAGDDLRYGLDRPVLNPYFIALARRGMEVPAIV
jgi:3'(2'), 5'-bisphosphate nucleotidase